MSDGEPVNDFFKKRAIQSNICFWEHCSVHSIESELKGERLHWRETDDIIQMKNDSYLN